MLQRGANRGLSNKGLLAIFGVAIVIGVVVIGAIVGLGVLAFATSSGDSGGGNAASVDNSGSASTPTPAATPEPSTTHEVGETFTVGSGEQAIEYRVTNYRTSQIVGDGMLAEEADGVFVIVDLDMTNVGGESLSISSNIFALVDGDGNEYDTDSDAIIAVDDNIVFEQLDPEVTKSGVIVFDVPQDQTSRELRIDPAGLLSGADSHFVTLE